MDGPACLLYIHVSVFFFSLRASEAILPILTGALGEWKGLGHIWLLLMSAYVIH